MNNKLVLIVGIVMVVIIVVVFFWFPKKPQIIYPLELFPPIQNLNHGLLQQFDLVKNEVTELQKVPISDIVINKGAIYSASPENLLKQIRETDGWTMGWDSGKGLQQDTWKQYPIIYKGEIFKSAKKRMPTICSLLEPIKECFHTVFISTIKPYGEIDRHCDGGVKGNVTEKDRLTYHFNIDCPKTSILSVEDLDIVQHDKHNIIFDSAFEHEVKNNSPLPRTILCAKFFISKSKGQAKK
jgi:hypothetical protein